METLNPNMIDAFHRLNPETVGENFDCIVRTNSETSTQLKYSLAHYNV